MTENEPGMSPKLGTLRTRFAWWPVRLWEHYRDEFGTGYVRPARGWYWFCWVVEMWTMRGWTAYRDQQATGGANEAKAMD